jgi:hypothetical protein
MVLSVLEFGFGALPFFLVFLPFVMTAGTKHGQARQKKERL